MCNMHSKVEPYCKTFVHYEINLLVGTSLKASQHLGSWNSNTKP